jgi:hypothetical protein
MFHGGVQGTDGYPAGCQGQSFFAFRRLPHVCEFHLLITVFYFLIHQGAWCTSADPGGQAEYLGDPWFSQWTTHIACAKG